MEKLSDCPNWPALLDVETAALYLGGKPRRLFALIVRGYLVPMGTGHRNTDFLRTDIDTALSIARTNGDALVIPPEIKSVSQALAKRTEPAAA